MTPYQATSVFVVCAGVKKKNNKKKTVEPVQFTVAGRDRCADNPDRPGPGSASDYQMLVLDLVLFGSRPFRIDPCEGWVHRLNMRSNTSFWY